MSARSIVETLVEKLALQPHPEGGYYAQTFKSKLEVQHPLKDTKRSCSTGIYYLLNGTDFSAWHKLSSEEMWHHYHGGTLLIHIITADGNITTYRLGNVLEDAQPQCVIPANHWFAAELEDKTTFSLVGCTVSPGFEFSDFELANREELIDAYPSLKDEIIKLTRIEKEEELAGEAHTHTMRR